MEAGENNVDDSTNTKNKIRHAAILAIPLLLALLTYLPALKYPVLSGWDDQVYVINAAPRLACSWSNVSHWFSRPIHGCYLPLTMLTYMLDMALWELAPWGCHLQNIFWHMACVAGVFMCARKLGAAPVLSAVVASFFAIHPQRVESVVWISERKDVVCGAFYFWSAYLYLSADPAPKGWRRRAASLLLFAAALLAKPMAVSLPLVLLLLDLAKDGVERPNFLDFIKKRRFAGLVPHAILAALFCPVTYAAHKTLGTLHSSAIGAPRQIAIAIRNVAWYSLKTFVPGLPSPIHPRVSFDRMEILWIVLFYCGLGLAAYTLRRFSKRGFRILLLFYAAFAISLVPVVGLVPFGFIDYADRYSYIPSAILWIMTACLASTIPTPPKRTLRVLTVGAALYAAGLLTATSLYEPAWRSVYSLHKRACAIPRPNEMALEFLADLEIGRGDWKAVYELSARIRSAREPWMSKEDFNKIRQKADYLKAVALARSGHWRRAVPIFEKLRGEYRGTTPRDYRRWADYKTTLSMLTAFYNATGDKTAAAKTGLELIGVLKREGSAPRNMPAKKIERLKP